MPAWAWVDVETTGLGYDVNPPYENRDDVILELAAVITDADLNVIDTFGPYVIHADADKVALMDDFVTQMHTRTGLIDKVAVAEDTVEDLDAALAEWFDSHGLTSKVILAGSSVKLDFDFIRRHLPVTFAKLHYRVIDVSTFKETLRVWAPGVVAELEARKDPSHEAMDDILGSIAELRFYRDKLNLADVPAAAA